MLPQLYLGLMPIVAHAAFLSDVPPAFAKASAKWAYYSYQNSDFAVLPGDFNRSVYDAPWGANTTDPGLTKANLYLNTTDFIAYDQKFFDFIGPKATIKHVQTLAYQTHEASCFNPHTRELFFAEWGPPGGINGVHNWQYILDVDKNRLHNVTTHPHTINAHGCVFYQGAMYVVSDGGLHSPAELAKIEPKTLKRTVLLNNYYQQPFMGFNDLDIDPEGNFWLTDSYAGYGRDIHPFTPPTNPTLYMVNGTTMRPRVIDTLNPDDNTNGVAYRASKNGGDTLYLSNTGGSKSKPVSKLDPYGRRNLVAYDINPDAVLPSAGRFFSNPIEYFWDGVRVSRNGWVFGAAGQGVDVIDPDTGLTIGTIRVGGGSNVAVNVAFGEHEMWIVGKGGVWHVTGIKERLDRKW